MFKKAIKNFPPLGRGVRGEGFTLAEVLITLMIIGIVAALTIPSVISNYQQQEFKTGLKKAVSVLNEAIQTNIAQDGETPYENNDLFTYLQRHMSVIKNNIKVHRCMKADGTLGTTTSCGFTGNDLAYTMNSIFYTTDGMRFEYANRVQLKLHESDTYALNMIKEVPYPGASFYAYRDKNGACGSYGLANNPHETLYPPCIIVVDVNGDKKPNYLSTVPTQGSTAGTENVNLIYSYPSPADKKLTDVFNILITEDRAIPFGVVAQRAMYSK